MSTFSWVISMTSDDARLAHNIRRRIQAVVRRVFSPELRGHLARNRVWKDAFRGRRCVIVGNGPSLRDTELTLLRDEIVFTVNEIPRSDLFPSLRPRFHVFIDPNYGALEPGLPMTGDFTSMLATLGSIPGLSCIASTAFVDRLRVLGPPALEWLGYYNRLDPHAGRRMDFGLWGLMPQAQTVVLSAGWAALSMGFKEVIFIGVDMTGFLEHYARVDGQVGSRNAYSHPYDLPRNYADWASGFSSEFDNESWLRATAEMFRQFKAFGFQANIRGCRVINATSGGALDVFQRLPLHEALG